MKKHEAPLDLYPAVPFSDILEKTNVKDEERSMSKETEKIFKEVQKYIDENTDGEPTEEELNELIRKFVDNYNGQIPGPLTPDNAEDAEDYLELACSSDNAKDALKYAKQALKLDPFNYDAEAMVIEFKSTDVTKLVRDYEKAVKNATKHMDEEGYFEEENIGDFWAILETRPYMRLRRAYLDALVNCRMMRRAEEECKELLRLCENDNMGVRFVLMHIYAYFEDEAGALELSEKYGGYDNTQILLPMSVIFYKKGNYAKSRQYLKRLVSRNKDFVRFAKMFVGDSSDELDDIDVGYSYTPNTIEELVIEMQDNLYLFVDLIPYFDWALREAKKFK